MTAYYNEFDAGAAAWLRELIKAGHIAPGDVDERSIADVRPDDLRGYTQCHFFAGIGGWSYALRLAGWPDDRPVWTGSCPCQPFSAAGRQKGEADERHLWPEFRRLIAECRPPAVFGEQVASRLGREWLAGVRADLEALGYAVGAADLCAAGVGAPHIRQRLYWMADAPGQRRVGERLLLREETPGRLEADILEVAGGCGARGLGDAERRGLQSRHEPEGQSSAAGQTRSASFWSTFDILPCTDGKSRRIESFAQSMVDGLPNSLGTLRPDIITQIETEIIAYGAKIGSNAAEAMRGLRSALLSAAKSLRGMGEHAMLPEEAILLAVLCQLAEQGWTIAQGLPRESAKIARRALRMLWLPEAVACPSHRRGLAEQRSEQSANALHPLSPILARHACEAWEEACHANAKAVFPLIVGGSNRVGLLRGYGNAIVPQVAAAFIEAATNSVLAP